MSQEKEKLTDGEQIAQMKQALSLLLEQAVKCVCGGGRNQDWSKATGQEFYVVYFLEVLGAKPETRLRYDGRLPFVPNAGMYIQVTKADDSREIERVYWTGHQFEVYLQIEDCVTANSLKRLGWRETQR